MLLPAGGAPTHRPMLSAATSAASWSRLMKAEELTEENLASAARRLARRDQDLALILRKFGPPPLWGRPPNFSTLIQIILEQQVSLASAASIYARMKKSTVPFRPETFVTWENLISSRWD